MDLSYKSRDGFKIATARHACQSVPYLKSRHPQSPARRVIGREDRILTE